MDQNNQQDDLFMALPVVKNAKHYRNVALQKLKPYWLIAILVAFLASLLGAIGTPGIILDRKSSESEVWITPDQIQQIEQRIEDGEIEVLTEKLVVAMEEQLAKTPLLAFLIKFFVWIAIAAVIIAVLITLFVASPVKVGYQRFHLEINDGHQNEIRIGTLFRFFKESYFKTIGLNVLHTLLMLTASIPAAVMAVVGVNVAWGKLMTSASLVEVFSAIGIGALLMLTGVIATAAIEIPLSYMYTYAHMIMADHPDVSPLDALRSSRQLMSGNKWSLFCLDFSFTGWYLLGVLCFGIGVLAVHPYHQTARTAFYHDIAKREAASETEFPSLDPDDYKIEE